MIRVTLDLPKETAKYLLEMFESAADTNLCGLPIGKLDAKILAKDLKRAITLAEADPPPICECRHYFAGRGIAECTSKYHPHTNLKKPNICSSILCPRLKGRD